MKRLLNSWFALVLLTHFCHGQTCTNNLIEHGSFTVNLSTQAFTIGKSFKTDLGFISVNDPTQSGSSIGNCCVAYNFCPNKWNGQWHCGTGEGGSIDAPVNYNSFLLIDLPPSSKRAKVWSQIIEVIPGIPYDLSFKITNVNGAGLNQANIAVLVHDAARRNRTIIPSTDPNLVTGLQTKPLNPALPWKMEWTTVTKKGIYFTPRKNHSTGTHSITLEFVAYNTLRAGQDIGIDDICLTSIAVGDITAQNMCIADDFSATYNGAQSIDKWYIDQKEYAVSGSTLNVLAANHNLTEGDHSVIAEYTSGSIAVKEYATFTVYDPVKHQAGELGYEWDVLPSPPNLILDPSHNGGTVSFQRYADDNKTWHLHKDVLPNGNSEFIAPMDCSIGATPPNEKFYICKTVDYHCLTSTPTSYTTCEYICPEMGCGVSFSTSTPTITSGGKYEVTFTAALSGAGNVNGYFWDFGDGNDVTTTSSQVSHEYDELGDYLVCLVSEMDNGCDYQGCETIEVCVGFDDALSNQEACIGFTPAMYDADPNDNDPNGTTYKWLLDGYAAGDSETLIISPEDLDVAGHYTLQLVKHSKCSFTSLDADINIRMPDPITFDYALDEQNGYSVWVKASRSPEPGETFLWFAEPSTGGGAAIFTNPVPSNIADPGSFDASSFGAGDLTVRLVVTDALGCVREVSQTFCTAASPLDCCDCPDPN